MFPQRGKIILLLFHAFKATSFLGGVVYQHSAVSTHFLLNFAVFANHSTSEKPFCFMLQFQNTGPCVEAIFSLLWKRNLDLSRTSVFPAVRQRMSLHLDMQVFRPHLGPRTENQLYSLLHLVLPVQGAAAKGCPGTSWDKKHPCASRFCELCLGLVNQFTFL